MVRRFGVSSCDDTPRNTCALDGNSAVTAMKSEREASKVRLATRSVKKNGEYVEVKTTVILATASVNVNISGRTFGPVRALCDSGAQVNLMRASCAKRFAIIAERCDSLVAGVSGDLITIKGKTKAIVQPWFSSKPEIELDFLLMPEEWTPLLPSKVVMHFKGTDALDLPLADPYFSEPGPVDILLGSEVWARIITSGIVRQDEGAVLQRTLLGYLAFGRTRLKEQSEACYNFVGAIEREELERQVRMFWEQEELRKKVCRSLEEERVEQLFVRTHQRDTAGRYVIRLPIDETAGRLGSTRHIALQRFHMLERRLVQNPKLKEQYVKFMREYERLGHMRLVRGATKPGAAVYHIPHHCVMQKFRVVFDASCKSTSGISLNDVQMVGEKLQRDIADTLMRFRRHKFAISADIKMMFRQVRVDEADWDYQRIFWREDHHQPLREYWLTVVTYGTAAAAHAAVRAMLQCAYDEELQYPKASLVVRNDFYMDDCLSGAETEQETKRLCEELSKMLLNGGFELRKWASNNQSVLRAINEPERQEVSLSESSEAKVLGMKWLTNDDELAFGVRELDKGPVTSKRHILGQIARLFDPNGLLGPIIVWAKILLQDLWKLKMGWDEQVPLNCAVRWERFREELSLLERVRIPRWIGTSSQWRMQIHGFADASSKAYGAVIFVRVQNKQGVTVRLLVSKSKVAPVKTVSIPRLELCAAELLGKLLSAVREACEFRGTECFLWSDSTVVLHWIQHKPNELKPYVAHRVASIQTNTHFAAWAHVSTVNNPADILSRGALPSELLASAAWWNGPRWLSDSEDAWPKPILSDPGWQERVREELLTRSNVEICAASIELMELICRYSDLSKLLRITSYVLRFIRNIKNSSYETSRAKKRAEQRRKRDTGRLFTLPSPSECIEALHFWIRQSQKAEYANEMRCLNTDQKNLPGKSTISSLRPVLDKSGLLRVGGRIGKSSYSYGQKHPLIVPASSRIGWLLLHDAHRRTKHGGPQLMMQQLRQKYWMPRLRNAARRVVHGCVTCARMDARVMEQLMGDLPRDRLRPSKPFLHSGVDFAGPITIKAWQGRTGRVTLAKGYVAVFVCMASRAVHLDLVTSLTMEAFVACFRRFIGRRGHCARMYSDNGRNFVGAHKELKEILRIWQGKECAERLNLLGTEWRFITPAAPHQGGLWEAAVKSMKFHLKRIIGKQTLTYEQLCTVLVDIEACLNSRPISALSDDPSDIGALTPGHFLVGEALIQTLPRCDEYIPESRLKAWRRLQQMTKAFWRRII